MALRWLSYARVSSQRVGSLAAVVAGASDSRPTSVDGLTTSYYRLLTQGVPIPPLAGDHVKEYLTQQHLWERYRQLRTRQAAELVGERIQLQDLALADPRVPSASGAITTKVSDEPPQLAVALGLLRAGNYTLTDRGRALKESHPAAIRELQSGNTDVNPFLVAQGSAFLITYYLLDSDFDFLQAAYHVNESLLAGSFTRMAFALQLDRACERLVKRSGPVARTSEDLQKLARLRELAAKIRAVREQKAEGNLETWGGGRTPDQLATLRLEFLVDVGLLSRKGRFDYRYEASEFQLGFIKELLNAPNADDFLHLRLCQAFLGARGHVEARALSQPEIWEYLRAAFVRLRSAMGYASSVDVVLLAIADLLNEGTGSYFELQDGIDVIKAQHLLHPRAVRFGVARGGGLTYVKITERGSKT